ncbi:uncharacterized protein H6S33_006631 [Morchella sextelata]|uniref:uncharacterized protein n=1 Tax=Morchella sextelata TaxID=1174677 RepID=UPI001D037591|nr:uncharacterized protein H6S33_006631 [Morchella sextelata]KAH0604254.1 hypothetical protein H6S33_006631 [Morchella sextelata]
MSVHLIAAKPQSCKARKEGSKAAQRLGSPTSSTCRVRTTSSGPARDRELYFGLWVSNHGGIGGLQWGAFGPTSSLPFHLLLSPIQFSLELWGAFGPILLLSKKTSTSTSTSISTFTTLGVRKTTIQFDLATILQSHALTDPSFDVATGVRTPYPQLPEIPFSATGRPYLPKGYFAQCTHEQVAQIVVALCAYLGGDGGDGKGGRDGYF